MNISSSANTMSLPARTGNNSMEENSSSSFAGRETSHAKTVKVYIKEPFTLTHQSLINPVISNKITLQILQIGDKTDVSICGDGADEYLMSLFQDKDDKISFVVKGQDETECEYQPPVTWGKRFVKWISQGARYCTTSEDSEYAIPTCHQFERFLHCGSEKYNIKIPMNCYPSTVVTDIKIVEPFSYLNLSDTFTQEWIHSMTYIGSGFCIGKFGTGCIAIQTVENSILYWSNKDRESPRSITLRTGRLS